MSDYTSISINVLNKSYQLKCKLNEVERLQQAGAYLDLKMQEVQNAGNAVGFERTAMMAALDVCYELMSIRDERDNYGDEVAERLNALSNRISGLVDDNHIDLHTTTVGEQQQMEL